MARLTGLEPDKYLFILHFYTVFAVFRTALSIDVHRREWRKSDAAPLITNQNQRQVLAWAWALMPRYVTVHSASKLYHIALASHPENQSV